MSGSLHAEQLLRPGYGGTTRSTNSSATPPCTSRSEHRGTLLFYATVSRVKNQFDAFTRYPCPDFRWKKTRYISALLLTSALLGLYGFDVRGPSSIPILQTHYWSNVLNVLRGKVGAEVLMTSVPR